MDHIYLDYNATSPIDPRVVEAMQPYISQHFGNPSSSHSFGVTARKAVNAARRQVADMLGCSTAEILFASGGSEANNYAIKGVAEAYRDRGNHIITSAIEHPSVSEVCAHLATQGFKITYLPVDEFGLIDPQQVEEAITPQTILISIMHANNEIGTIEPIAEITDIAHGHGVLIHSDCAQSLGKIPVTVAELGVDLLSFAGHKLYAPKGIGALYIRDGLKLSKQIHGADHELNRRAGTENVIEIVGLGKACQLAGDGLEKSTAHLHQLRDRLEAGVKKEFPQIRINGHPKKRLPNTASISFPHQEANTILSELDTVAASAGAACHADQVDVSTVLQAIQVPLEYAMGTIRFSVGRFTTSAEIDRAITEISRVVKRLQTSAALPIDFDDSGEIKLTHFTHGLGCACKLRPQLLEEVLQKLSTPEDTNILVGTDTADDAAVYRIDDNKAIIQTVDFFTPIVDDPYQFGAIAAANSLSDVYAMGGRPLFALNVVGFPSSRLPISVLEAILLGAQDKAEEAGIAIIGGHTVDDTEPKFGLAVTGIIHPNKIVANIGAQPGDALILTKPIGTGILSTALKRGLLEPDQADTLTKTMASLNKSAAEAMQAIGVNACTDITGFGLLGHLLEMMKGSGTTALIKAAAVPILPGAADLVTSGVVPGGTRDNRDYSNPFTEYADSISEVQQLLLNDAQTSGGLLIAVVEGKSQELLNRLTANGVVEACQIGQVVAGDSKQIKIL
ncbi:MAG: selenide, water dikinase SelD [Candidatus Marinimicrobia bacterium]|nr:selenide, water dikinase SelD [Candidatus Neomarinimicrobiota bacterium]